jgi:hypothetical protein
LTGIGWEAVQQVHTDMGQRYQRDDKELGARGATSATNA